MTSIFIYGEEADKGFRFLLERSLSKTYRVTYADGKSVFSLGKGYELTAFDYPRYDSVKAEKPVFLLKKACVPELCFSEESTVIACSENEEQIKALKDCPAHVITCGFGKTDTFSYTSIANDDVVVSLNREVTAFSGKKIQPLELPIEMPEGADIYSVIAFTALRILLDDYNSEIGKLI